MFICTGISWYIPISWPFRMGSHWQHWTAKSWLSALAVLNGGWGIIERGIIISFTWVNLKIWAHLLHSRSFHITYERPKNIYGIPLHVAVKLICLRIGLWIFLSKGNVLLLLQYDTGGGNQQCYLVKLKIWEMSTVVVMEVIPGGVNLTVQYSLSLSLYIYIHLPLHYM